MKSDRQLSEEIIKIIRAGQNYFTGTVSSINADGTVNVQSKDFAYSINAIAATPIVGSSPVAVFKVNGVWYAFAAQNEVLRENIAINRKSRPVLNKKSDAKPVNVQILYFVWDNGVFNWYVGGDREEPTLIYSEPDEDTFPPTSPNSLRGVDYTEYEMSSISNLNKQKFRAAISRTYASAGANDIFNELAYFYDVSSEQWMESTNSSVRYYKQLYSNNGENSDYDYVLKYRTLFIKNYRYLGNGYIFGTINLISRLFLRNYNFVESNYNPDPDLIPKPVWTVTGGVAVYDSYRDAPNDYMCHLSYIEPSETDSQEVIVNVDYSKNQYSYTLPCADTGGNLPLKNKVTTFNADLNTYIYEGEHYLNIGKSSYITEYIKKNSPTNIEREIRFYRDKKFVCKLKTSDSFGFTHDTFNAGGYTLNYINDKQLQRYSQGDVTNYLTIQGLSPEAQNYCLSLVNKSMIAESRHYETKQLYRAKCVVTNVTINNNGAAMFTVVFSENPQVISYISNAIGIFGYRSYGSGVLYQISNSYYDFALRSTDIGLNFTLLTNNYLGAYSHMAEFYPFDPDDPNYLHYAIMSNAVNYDIYYQYRIYGQDIGSSNYTTNYSSFTNSPAATSVNNYSHLSVLRYLDNNFCTLYGNKLYRFNILYEYTDGVIDNVAEAISRESSDLSSIRSISGIDNKAICVIEVWEINEATGAIKRQNKILTVPVYGIYTGNDVNWYFSGILDIDLGFNR